MKKYLPVLLFIATVLANASVNQSMIDYESHNLRFTRHKRVSGAQTLYGYLSSILVWFHPVSLTSRTGGKGNSIVHEDELQTWLNFTAYHNIGDDSFVARE
jgi:hypothetical protein